MTNYAKQYPGIDPDCFPLADHFLDGVPHEEVDRWDLAACLQNAVEDWFAEFDRKHDEQEDDDVEAPPEPDDD